VIESIPASGNELRSAVVPPTSTWMRESAMSDSLIAGTNVAATASAIYMSRAHDG
jgi:hypothetical protein